MVNILQAGRVADQKAAKARAAKAPATEKRS
jgi:hypothetical protein